MIDERRRLKGRSGERWKRKGKKVVLGRMGG